MKYLAALMAYENALDKAKKQRSKDAALRVIDLWARDWFRDRRAKVTDEKIMRIREMAEDDAHLGTIAEEVGLSVPTVRRVLAREGRYKAR